MRKLLSIFTMVFALVFVTNSQAGVSGLGWDAGNSQLTARVGDNLDLGVGGVSDERVDLTLSANYLHSSLVNSGAVKAYPTLGVNYDVDAKKVDAFVGLMPEITFGGHLAFSTRFGVAVPVYNDGMDLHFSLAGSPVDLTRAVNFKILF